MTFFTADLHFGHKNIIKYENRPFDSVEQMDEQLIKNWNAKVTKGDKVFVLGDFSFTNKERIKELVAALNGVKILVLGNHDRERSLFWWKTESGFEEVYAYPIIYKQWLMLSHEPLDICENMPYANIYGHVHGNPAYVDANANSCCVSVERTDYAPISLSDMLTRMGLIEERGN